ncbi:hypothetical protein BDV38DRAFT_101271 [Aspergillus pseudotamarii]|uniref:Uncharacterized protein n=1 Tax=Aspergillus pseudotamarii TaxID=132259 RepID=A0A5N6STD7_ASPPS|nr:uncharacterized protein BDV38DRAFT_101271 [Aspergillus pseudotamarii]KAE8137089.1 hypothetical protein BDV38DRAFT_101271 [Aspergillus pseudotamarii]
MNAYRAVTKPYLGHMMMDTFPFPGNAEVRTFFPPSVISVRNLSPRILYQLNITGGPFSWLIIIYCHLSHGRSDPSSMLRNEILRLWKAGLNDFRRFTTYCRF